MAPPKKDPPLQSPLVSAFNNIVNINRSKSQMRSTQRSYNEFLRFMTVEVKNLEAIKLPSEKKIKKLANINVSYTFGSAGSLLSGLVGGALDVGGFLGNLFKGKKRARPAGGGFGRGGRAAARSAEREVEESTGKALRKGTKLRIPGVRGLPILSAALAGLDFAEGISEGESVGKAGAGAAGSAAGAAGGALAGAALAGAIGQALVPIPGLGFVLGAAVGGLGSFAGGYLADRAYEAATGEGKVKQKTKEKLKQQEQKQKAAAAAAKTSATLPQVLDKFDSVVTKFEKSIANLHLSETETSYPTGYDEELPEGEVPKLPDGTTKEGAESIQYGTGNAEFGETGNVQNSAGWVHGHFQSDTAAGVTRDTTMVVKALLKQGSPVYLNPGVDLLPSKQYSDAEIEKYVENARKAHTHSGTGKSIDVFVKKGTKVPVPLTNVGPTDPNGGFGGYGRGGIAGYIQGTRTWIGHLKPGSKSGLSEQKGEIKPKGRESGEMEKLQPQSTTTPQATAVSQTKPVTTSTLTKPQVAPSPDMIKKYEMAWQYRNNPFARGRIEDAWKSMSTEQKQQAISWAESKGYDWREMKLPAPVPSAQIQGTSRQPTTPTQIQQYPDYNLPQSSVTLMPIIMGGGGGGSQQRPIVIAGGGGGEGTTIMPPIPEGQVLNSLFKTILLTNLSGT